MVGHLLVVLTMISVVSCGTSKPSRPLAEQNFLNSVHQQPTSFTKGRTDDNLVQLGHNNCDALDSGISADLVGTSILKLDPKAKAEDVGAFVATSVLTLCPQHANDLPHP